MNARNAVLIVLGIALLAAGPVVRAEEEPAPKVEVVFVLDTTGSMSGLIEGAKVKIWKIVNQIVSGKPVPEVRVGLVAYRDRGDAYVTKQVAMTTDLDAVYTALRGFTADGGGDSPESVNQALHEAVKDLAWSREERTLRIIYLVGDCPPHMDYQDDVLYPVTCEAAARAGIIVNTVQCGADTMTVPIWQDIARRAEGRYVQIDQSGGMQAIETPFDKRIAELSDRMSAGTLFYGDKDARDSARERLDDAEKGVADAPAESKAERAGYLAKSGRLGEADLVALLALGELTLDKIDPAKLPAELSKLSPEELKAKLTKLVEERKALQQELVELDRKRAAHIKAELEKAGQKGDSFDARVLEALKEQAKRIGVTYD
ncbi:MAG: VWA domain-containing protein [Planctomycetes bacterium]|jgi:Mg-chelatase subunit ChlD|nr:VWA domain-containing protein [Planctomycetota bacterium]